MTRWGPARSPRRLAPQMYEPAWAHMESGRRGRIAPTCAHGLQRRPAPAPCGTPPWATAPASSCAARAGTPPTRSARAPRAAPPPALPAHMPYMLLLPTLWAGMWTGASRSRTLCVAAQPAGPARPHRHGSAGLEGEPATSCPAKGDSGGVTLWPLSSQPRGTAQAACLGGLSSALRQMRRPAHTPAL